MIIFMEENHFFAFPYSTNIDWALTTCRVLYQMLGDSNKQKDAPPVVQRTRGLMRGRH